MTQTKTSYYAFAEQLPGKGWNVLVYRNYNTASEYRADYDEVKRARLLDPSENLGPNLAEWEAKQTAKRINSAAQRNR